jgi:hypothetical protein
VIFCRGGSKFRLSTALRPFVFALAIAGGAANWHRPSAAIAAPPGAATPSSVAPTAPTQAPEAGTLAMVALFSGDRSPIGTGLEWRVFKVMPDAKATVVQRSNDPSPIFKLDPGEYVVHVAYGFANASKRVTLANSGITDQILLAAGALRFAATVADQPIPRSKVSYAVYLPEAGDPEGHQIADGIKSGQIVRLAEGVYHIVSTYGDTNATVRADIKVESGKLTDATLRHRAATVTLKLVEAPGGEALADTTWSVLSPGGDIVQESVGAFATMTLAEGLYSVVARHAGKTYARDFKVDTGRDGDVEVLAKDGE